jgi:hypothetical protein
MRQATWTGLGLVGLVVGLSAGLTSAGATGQLESPSMAGYQASAPSNSSTVVRAQFVLPPITCTGTKLESDAPTVQLTTANDGLMAATAILPCAGPTFPTYQALAMGSSLAMTVTPGDKIRLIARADPSLGVGGVKATVDDLTTGVSKSNVNTFPEEPNIAFVGLQRLGGSIPDFGRIVWVQATPDGRPLSSFDPQAFNQVKDPNHPKTLVSTSPLSPAGFSFTTTRLRGG